jgi:hypothetical protein
LIWFSNGESGILRFAGVSAEAQDNVKLDLPPNFASRLEQRDVGIILSVSLFPGPGSGLDSKTPPFLYERIIGLMVVLVFERETWKFKKMIGAPNLAFEL